MENSGQLSRQDKSLSPPGVDMAGGGRRTRSPAWSVSGRSRERNRGRIGTHTHSVMLSGVHSSKKPSASQSLFNFLLSRLDKKKRLNHEPWHFPALVKKSNPGVLPPACTITMLP